VTEDNETIVFGNVTIIGASNLASSLPSDASKLYGKNVLNFLKLLINKEGVMALNFADDIINSTCITDGGKVISPIITKNYNHANIS